MELSLIISGFQLAAYLSFLGLCAAGIGAVVSGIFKVTTQIEDTVIGTMGRFVGILLLFYFFSGLYSSQVAEYAARVWGGTDYYQ